MLHEGIDEMGDDRIRARWIAGTRETRVYGIAEGEHREIIIVPNNVDGRYVLALSSGLLLGGDFRDAVERDVPAEIRDEVLAWLRHPAPDTD